MYEVKIKPLHVYYADWIKRRGIKNLLKRTDSGYPRFLALGFCNHKDKQIIICKRLNWKLRLMHEIGHEFKLKHTMKKGRVMHPWGFRRGDLIGSHECGKITMQNMKKRYEEVLKNEQCV